MKEPAAIGMTVQARKNQTGRNASRLRIQWAGPALIAATFVVLTAWTWRKWPDILVDFGRELYIPWQLAAGKVLYRDIAYFNGPFSPYLNALWFHLFGVSLTTLIFGNLAILAAITWLMYRMFNAACDRFTAMVSSLVFLCVFAFSEYTVIGNYNFISPYSHELTHGIGLTVGMISCLWRYALRRQLHMSICAGVLLGCVFLTKAEVFVAAAAAAMLGVGLLYASEKPSAPRTGLAILAFAAAMFLPIALCFALLAMQMPAMQALRGIAGTWASVLDSRVASDPFYQRSMGFDQPWPHFVIMIRIFVGMTLLAGTLAVADIARSLDRRWMRRSMAASVALFAAALLVKQSPAPWLVGSWLPLPLLMLGWPLPLATLAIGAVITVFCIRRRADQRVIARLAPLVMWAAFAFALLGKIILYPRLYHYGFALAMPATLVLVVCFVWLIPEVLRRSHGGGDLLRRFAVTMVIADVIFYLAISNIFYSRKDFAVGSNGDSIVTYGPRIQPRGTAIAQVLQRIESLVPPEATFVVLPEGVMLNYLSRRLNPTPYINFMPPEIAVFGEAAILDAFKAQPPDFILLVHKDTSEYGVGYFGVDPSYGKQIMDWVERHYSAVEHILDEPFKDERFGIKILILQRDLK